MSNYSVWRSSAALLTLLQALNMLAVAPCRAMPHFTSTPYSVTVSEAAPIGSILINITAVPGTPGNSLIYNIFHNPTIIQIDNITGSITLVGSLDYEQDAIYEFNVEVFEGADVVMTGVTVDVVNENDNPLTCEQSLVVVSRPEGPPSPSSIPMSCVDRDEPSPESVSYQIVSGNDTGLFHIDIHGTIHVVSELDYEKETLHELIVSATSGGTLMLSPDSTLLITVLVVVEPTNEYSPVFDNAEVMFTFSISESAAIGTTIGTIHATDADHGKDGDLVFSADSEVPQTVFTIGSTTGQLVLIDSLDYEQATSHELTVTVSDSSPVASKRRSVIATVLINVENVNEYNPAFSEEVYSVSISEVVTAGSEIASVECTDTDSNSTLTYSIESGNNASHFSINSFTGKVTLASQVEFDPNRPSPFQLIVQCEDSGSPSRTTRATLFVEIEGHSRNMPPALSSTEFMIELSENSSLGTMVVSLATVATDSNRGLAGPLQFSLVHNSSCPEDVFQIVPTSGLIYTVGVLDYETADEYQCVVSVSNMESTASAELGISISVTNLNDEVPLCSPSLYTLTIPEDGAVGSDLLTLSCSDADNDGLEYSIVGTSNTFQLTQSGTQTSTLSLLAPVNFDVFSTHHLHINVSDSQHSLQLTLFVYVEQSNEHAPTFNQSVYDCSVPEITAIGSVLCTVVARDSDSGPDGHIRYSIISGNDENTFAINSLSGDIVLTGYIDYETIQGHIVLVQASDNGDSPLNSSVQVRITVLDSNDNAPVISPLITATIAENSPAGSTVTDLECSDVDTGTNGDVIMNIQSLSSINADGIEVADSEIIYGIESLTNKLVLDSIIDFEAGILYKLTLTCRDNGIQPLTSSSTILISVTPLNEFAPVLNKNYSATVAESSGIGTSILQVMATDKDAGLDGHIKYSIEPEEDGKDFLHIGATSGHVSSQKPLNCAWGTEHGFTITAVDKGFPALSSQSKLYVTFENCQLGQLTPQQAIYFANVMENSPVNTEVMTVACDTERVWEGGNAPEYGILNPVESPFKIDPVSGRISISTPLDYEQTTSYMLQLNCTDPSRPLSYAYFSVYVTVLPDNEYPPEFSLATYEAEVAEDVPPGTSVLEVEARDNDSGNDGSVVYSIQESMQSFAVDSRTGVIFTLAFLDREEESFYLFHIAAVDQLAQGDSMHSSVTEIRVSVMDTNDNSPQCDRVVYHINMSPIINVGHKIVGLECTDADSDLNSELHYSLYADSTSSLDLFSLDESTGDLFLARKLDSNSALVHQMTITIGDSGNPSLSTTALVVVEVRSSQVVIGGGSESYARVEGTNNAVTVTLKYLSMELWHSGAKESFQRAMAHSVTYYCALLPEACSLLSGCAEFHRRKRSTNDKFFTVFSEGNVIFLPNTIHEFPSSNGNTNLNVTYYVTLPEGIQRTDYRTTDYVIPGTTLASLLKDEQPVIEAQVRDSVSSSLTQKQSTDGETGRCWVLPVVVTSTVLVVVVCAFVAVVSTYTYKRTRRKSKKGATVVPLNVTSSSSATTIHQLTSHEGKKNERRENGKRLSLRDLVHNTAPATSVELNQGDTLPQSEEMSDSLDDVSTIFLSADSNDYSLQGRPRSSDSPTLTSGLSSNSAENCRNSSQDSYKQNFPFEPPRNQQICDRHDCARTEKRSVQASYY